MPTPWQASSISFLTKPKLNRRKAFFAKGRLKREIRRHSAILGVLPCVTRLKFKLSLDSRRFGRGTGECIADQQTEPLTT